MLNSRFSVNSEMCTRYIYTAVTLFSNPSATEALVWPLMQPDYSNTLYYYYYYYHYSCYYQNGFFFFYIVAIGWVLKDYTVPIILQW